MECILRIRRPLRRQRFSNKSERQSATVASGSHQTKMTEQRGLDSARGVYVQSCDKQSDDPRKEDILPFESRFGYIYRTQSTLLHHVPRDGVAPSRSLSKQIRHHEAILRSVSSVAVAEHSSDTDPIEAKIGWHTYYCGWCGGNGAQENHVKSGPCCARVRRGPSGHIPGNAARGVFLG